ncbi:sulfatase-like hydrolase/transferase [Gammaproteobacteria bacterium]|nr:sulfatase-like hydrolase/transferase [Gammaproteobacteria bacterium]
MLINGPNQSLVRSGNPWLLYFTAINALLAALISLSTIPGDQLSTLTRGALFVSLALPGHFFFIALILYLPLSIATKLVHSKRRIVIPAALLFSLFVFIIFVDARIFELYRFHINGMVLNLLTGEEAAQIISIPVSTWLIAIEGLAALCVGQWMLAETLFKRFERGNHKPLVIWFVAITIMLSGQAFYAYSDARGDKQVTGMLRFIPWAQPLTAKRAMKKFGFAIAADDELSLGVPLYSSLNYPKHPLVCKQAKAKQKNVVMLVVDSMRYDMLTAKTMPNAYSLLNQGQVFENHYSGGNATRFGIFSLLYGLPGSYWFSMLGEQRGSVLFDVLVQQDYQLFVHGSASWSSPEFDRTAFAAINDQIVSGKGLQAENPGDERHRDTIVTDDFINKITDRDKDRPFFGLLFFDAPHNFSRDGSAPSPFQPALQSVNYLALDNNYKPTEFFNRYKNSIYYDDMLIGQVIEKLKQQQLLNDTILIITSDHGQEFNESQQNYWGHNGNFSKYQTKVPLMIHWPDESAKTISHRTTSEDIVPTLMQRYLGCENPISDYSTGQNLFSEKYKSKSLLIESWSRRALLTDDRIFVFESNGLTLIYDHNYRELSNETANSNLIFEAMKSMGDFLQ